MYQRIVCWAANNNNNKLSTSLLLEAQYKNHALSLKQSTGHLFAHRCGQLALHHITRVLNHTIMRLVPPQTSLILTENTQNVCGIITPAGLYWISIVRKLFSFCETRSAYSLALTRTIIWAESLLEHCGRHCSWVVSSSPRFGLGPEKPEHILRSTLCCWPPTQARRMYHEGFHKLATCSTSHASSDTWNTSHFF